MSYDNGKREDIERRNGIKIRKIINKQGQERRV
jgi:hypothetical protein